MNDELISRMLNNYRRVVETLDPIFENPEKCSIYNDRPDTKMTGFTRIKGRKHPTKKQRKQQLKNKKQ